MAKIKKHFPWGLTISFLLGLVAALPILRGIPEGTDSLFHLYRVVQINTLLENGVLFSRWAPDMVYGYGYPLFNYYAPLSYYVTTILHLLGLNIVGALLATFGLALVITSIFTFLWVRDLFGEAAGLVAAAMFVFSPYMMINSLHRGALAEQVALALLPILFWSVRRFIVSNGRRYMILSSVIYAGLILSHNITALLFTPILLVYGLLLTHIHYRGPAAERYVVFKNMARVLIIFLIGLSLSAFYWLPAFFESHLVQLSQAYLPGVFDFEQNFLKPGDLLAPPVPADLRLVRQNIPISLSLIAVVFGAIALIAFRRFRNHREHLAHITFAAAGLFVCSFMALAISKPVWEQIPLLHLLQFPWRFVGLSSLFVAYLGGVGAIVVASEISDKVPNLSWFGPIFPLIVIFAALIYAIPWRFVDYHVMKTPIDVVDSFRFEQESGMIGTTATGEYLPAKVEQLPQPQEIDLNNRYARFDKQSLPEGARVLASTYGPLNYSIKVETPEPFTAIFNTFFFEGWLGEIDGDDVLVSPVGSQGLIGVDVPAGNHQLTLHFGNTELRRWACWLSWLGLLLSVAAVFFYRHESHQPPIRFVGIHLSWGHYAFVAIFLIVIVVFRLVYLDSRDSVFKNSRFDGQQVSGVSRAVQANFGNKLFLLGIDDSGKANPSEPYELTLYWRIKEPIDQAYSASVVIMDDYGNLVGQSDNQFAGNVPTTEWDPADYARGDHRIRISAGTPPGDYRLQIRVYQEGQPENRLDLLDVNGVPIGQTFSVGTIRVDRPTVAPDLSDMDPEHVANVTIGKGIRLAGYTLLEENVATGDTAHLTLYWEAVGDPSGGNQIQAYVTREDGQKDVLIETPLIPNYPESLWQNRDIWQMTYPLVLPATLSSGTYTIALETNDGRPISLDTLIVDAPDHLMERPTIAFPMNTTFGDLAVLEGFDYQQNVIAGQEIPVTLVWRSLGETQTSYKTFVHLVDREGRLVTGSDVIPGDWQRPTTGWISGEFVFDSHLLSLPEDLTIGAYQLRVGIYDAEDVQRLRTTDGDDFVTLEYPLTVRAP